MRLLQKIYQFRLKELETADAFEAQRIAPHIANLSRRINKKTKVKMKFMQTELFNNCKPKRFEGWNRNTEL
jgi:hypothetical protein